MEKGHEKRIAMMNRGVRTGNIQTLDQYEIFPSLVFFPKQKPIREITVTAQ